MGLGKSYCSIMLAVKLYLEGKIDRVLVVAPNGITDQWINEQFPEHCVPDYVDHLWQNKKTKIYSGEKRLFFSGKTSHLKLLTVNIDRFSYGGLDKIPEIVDFVRDGKTLIIVDEATDIKNHKSNRTENLTELGREADYKLILTGTPVTNSPFDVYAMVNFLKPGFWKVPYHVFEKR